MLLHKSLPADHRAGNLCRSRPPQILPTTNPVAPTIPVSGSDCHATARRESVGARSGIGSLILSGHWSLLPAAWARLLLPLMGGTRLAYSTPRHWEQGGAVSWAALASEAYFVENRLPPLGPEDAVVPAVSYQKWTLRCCWGMAAGSEVVPLLHPWWEMLYAKHVSQRQASW